MDFSVREVDLKKLNSATQYPSIKTYHVLGERGRLTEERHVDFADVNEVLVTEKIDGSNTRIILLPDETYVIGSRTELLYARGDVIRNPIDGIVDAAKEAAEKLLADYRVRSAMRAANGNRPSIDVVFGEVYGGRIHGWKQYTGAGDKTGFRVFDVAMIPLLSPTEADWEQISSWDANRISGWRDHGQSFLDFDTVRIRAESAGLKTVPIYDKTPGWTVPKTLFDTFAFLKAEAHETFASLDLYAKNKPEGVVLRTKDRKKIAKLRFEEYERTFRAAVEKE